MDRIDLLPYNAFSYEGTLASHNSHSHYHSKHQILITTNGLILFEDDYTRNVLSCQNAAFIPARCNHRAQAIGENIKFWTVYFDSSSFVHLTGNTIETIPNHTMVFQASSLLRQLVQKICEFPQQEIYNDPSLTALKLLYLLLLEEHPKRLPFSLPQAQHKDLQEIIAFIDKSYEEPITLEILENHFAMSRRTIERMFKKHLQMNVFDYVRLRRVFQATIDLTTTELSILQISLKVGYESLSSFYKAFSSIVGETPKEYRKNSLYRS